MGETVLVTGASGGIGGAVAALFARRGAAVMLHANRHPQRAKALCETLTAQGATVACCTANLADEAQVEEMFRQCEDFYGETGTLVYCAGHAQQKLFTDITTAEWQAMFDAHVTGAFLCCRRALPAMVRKKRGNIVLLSSMWGQVGASCEVHYSAAKAAVIGLTKALAKEVAPSGVRVNCVAPGAVNTAMMAGFTKEDVAALEEEIPLGRMASPEEIAQAVAFLASKDAAYITGQVLAPNGGYIV